MTARNIRAAVYTTDDGDDYIIGIDDHVFGQQTGDPGVPIVGGSLYTADPALDSDKTVKRPRGVYVTNGTRTKFVVCLTKTAPLYQGDVTTVTLLELGSATPLTWTRHKPRAERLANERKPD